MKETDKPERKLPNQEIDYFKIARILLSRWYWILGSVLITMSAASIYLWYTPKSYATSALMKFEEKKSDLSDFSFSSTVSERSPSRTQSELFVLQSTQLVMRAIKTLDYRISFYIAGRVRTTEIYPQKPLNIVLLTFDSLNFYHDLITFKAINASTFSLSYPGGAKTAQKIYFYDKPITLGPTSFTIKSDPNISTNTSYLFKFNAPEEFLGRAKGGFHAAEIAKNSNIIALQETDSNPVFAADILNAILDEYVKYDLEQKTKSASQIIRFIDRQLDFLQNEVNNSEKSLQDYKQQKKIINISSASEDVLTKSKNIEGQRSVIKLQLLAIAQFKDQLIKEKESTNINLNLSGAPDQLLSGLITSYNALLADKTELLKTYNNSSQPVKDVNNQLLRIKNTAIANINASQSVLEKNMAFLDGQLKDINVQVGAMPKAERDMISLQRNFDVKDKVYSFLSEKKLDAQISSSAILPGVSVVERAQVNASPITPNDHEIDRTATISGILIGLGIIILIRILNPYIYDKETVESLTAIPIIGVIRKFPDAIDEDNSQLLALSRPRSMFAESVRSVRTNLNFLAAEKSKKIICITSEVAGEGKSFVAVNLSSTLALIDKKVILIGADLRRSRLHKTFQVPNDLGLSNYLAIQCESKDIIRHSGVANLDFIVSGPVPPNPSELLHSTRMATLIAELKLTYDIIVIDTAPVGLVSDSLPLIRVSDINVFVIRSGKSKYYAATVPQRIADEYKLLNTVIVLNAFDEDLLHSRYYTTRFTGDGYASQYYYSDYSGYVGSDYYVDNEEKKWWQLKYWLKK